MRRIVAPLLALLAVTALALAYGGALFRKAPPQDVIAGRDGWLYAGWDQPADAAKARLAVCEIARVNGDLRQAGAHLTVLLVPRKATAVPQHLPASMDGDRAAHDRDLAALRSAGVDVVDGLPPLAPLGDRAFAQHDAHWTPQAGELEAAAVAAALAPRLGVTLRPDADQHMGAWQEERRLGDLARLLRDRGKPAPGEEVFRRRAYVAPPPGAPRVDLVGNSFVGGPYGVQQKLEQALGVPVRLTPQFAADGSWTAMAGFPPKGVKPAGEVVWQIGQGALGLVGKAARCG